jgi:hypothetical protein
VVTLTVAEPFPVAEVGETASQVVSGLALQLKVPPPVLLIFTVWVMGLPPPCWAVKDRLVGLAPMAGGTGAAVTVKVTGTVIVEVVPVAVSVIVPVRVAAVSVPVIAVSVTVPLPLPDVAERVNHAMFSLADQARVPPPVLLMLRV